MRQDKDLLKNPREKKHTMPKGIIVRLKPQKTKPAKMYPIISLYIIFNASESEKKTLILNVAYIIKCFTSKKTSPFQPMLNPFLDVSEANDVFLRRIRGRNVAEPRGHVPHLIAHLLAQPLHALQDLPPLRWPLFFFGFRMVLQLILFPFWVGFGGFCLVLGWVLADFCWFSLRFWWDLRVGCAVFGSDLESYGGFRGGSCAGS